MDTPKSKATKKFLSTADKALLELEKFWGREVEQDLIYKHIKMMVKEVVDGSYPARPRSSDISTAAFKMFGLEASQDLYNLICDVEEQYEKLP